MYFLFMILLCIPIVVISAPLIEGKFSGYGVGLASFSILILIGLLLFSTKGCIAGEEESRRRGDDMRRLEIQRKEDKKKQKIRDNCSVHGDDLKGKNRCISDGYNYLVTGRIRGKKPVQKRRGGGGLNPLFIFGLMGIL